MHCWRRFRPFFHQKDKKISLLFGFFYSRQGGMNDFFFFSFRELGLLLLFLRKEIPPFQPLYHFFFSSFLASLRVKHRINTELDFCGLPVFFHMTLSWHLRKGWGARRVGGIGLASVWLAWSIGPRGLSTCQWAMLLD
ncbi:hypothetical protein LX32DRAFT_303061 [Colletotrichum zoysiae]|uniref:Uncharacterized protein n=1 Tax=Colletotrichum zoysiae TaxID=1216348 RepID=A0AAD9HL84_9PEZI|nr:hypothetical protein LX32DRAFT_303061 [Colletotrichum zoysiae]